MNTTKGCDGKIRYTSRSKARDARKAMQSNGHGRGGPLNAYCCEFCGFWHLGHMPAAVRNGTITKSKWLAQ